MVVEKRCGNPWEPAPEADEVRLALDWQGFVVDASELEALVHEVGRKKGLNQHEFLTFMRKYHDLEVQKLIRTNQSYRWGWLEPPKGQRNGRRC